MAYQLLNNKADYLDQLYVIADCAFDYGAPWTISQFEKLISQPYILIIGSLLPGKRLQGFVIASLSGPEAEIYNIAVDPTYQHKGVGQGLMKELKRNLEINQVKDLFLEVRSSNLTAQNFYKNQGFTIVGLRRNYYSNPKEDGLVLKLKIGQ